MDQQNNAVFQELATLPACHVEGRLRRCRGSLLVCGGLDGLVGLGDVCQIEPTQHNHCEYPGSPAQCREPLLGEVVALDEAGVHLLPYGEIKGLGLGARVRIARGHDRLCPGPGWLGRILDPLSRPLDQGPPLPPGPISYPVHGTLCRRTGGATSGPAWISACAR
jgi:flagellum-specific ATP synthase